MTNVRELLDADVDRFGGVGCGERSDGRAKNATAAERGSEGRQIKAEIPREQESYMPLDPRCRIVNRSS